MYVCGERWARLRVTARRLRARVERVRARRGRVCVTGEAARVRGECETEALLSATNWRDQMRRDVECIMHCST